MYYIPFHAATAARFLIRSRSYSLAAVSTLAVGLAAAIAVMAVANAVLLRPLPYPRPDRLYRLNASTSNSPQTFTLSPIELTRLQQARTLEQVEGMTALEMSLTTDGNPETLKVGAASAGFLGMFGLQPGSGRGFTREEDSQRLPVAILDGGAWMRRFGGDPKIIGQSIRLDGTPYVVIGITPQGYRPLLQAVDVWIPLGAKDDPSRQFLRNLLAAARLAPNRSESEARAEILTIQQQIAKDYPQSHGSFALNFIDLRESLYGSYRPALAILGAAVISLLLIACTNVGNLTLCRVLDRRGEFALRASLGASRASIVRDQFTETAIVCLVGGAAGLLLAWWLLPLLLAVYPAAIPADAEPRIDVTVIMAMLGLIALSAMVAGLLPAFRAGGSPALSALAESSLRNIGSARERHTRNLLVIAQVALSLVLLGVAGVVLSSMQRLNRTDPGFDAEGVLTLQLAPPARYGDAAARASFLDRVLSRISELPEVQAAGSTQTTFQLNTTMTTRAEIEGRAAQPGEFMQVNIRHVTPGYVDAMRVRVVDGRPIDSRDRIGAPMVAMVSQSFARRYWPDQRAVGQRVKRVISSGPAPWLTVVGVVGDVMDGGLGADLGPTLYVPYFQQNTATARISLTIRSQGDPVAVANAVRHAIWSVDPLQPIDQVIPLQSALDDSVAQPRFRSLLMGLFAAFGLALACLGVYSVAAYGARQRAREIGVRMALGADHRQVTRFLLGRSLPPILFGSLLGLVAIGLLMQRVMSLLYKPTAADAVYVAGAFVVLLLCAVSATFVPAGRAARVSPSEVMRID
ncbi:MAG TPA: ADOP family duplicated permease [Vicinamibacterales bacterium]|nr:ADOP family duplicated permease [Vicinamibacterales bacterium]